MRIQHEMPEPRVLTAAAAMPSSAYGAGKEQELHEMVESKRQKAVFVVRARQERTGILYTDRRFIKKPEDALAAFGKLLDRAGVEMLFAVALTKRGEPAAVRMIAAGGVDSCMVHVAEIMKLAILSNCPSVLLLHNHPSGSIEPSGEDKAVTEWVEHAAEIMGIQLLDHIIMGDLQNGYSIKYGQEIHLPETEPEEDGITGDGIRKNGGADENRKKKKNICGQSKPA